MFATGKKPAYCSSKRLWNRDDVSFKLPREVAAAPEENARRLKIQKDIGWRRPAYSDVLAFDWEIKACGGSPRDVRQDRPAMVRILTVEHNDIKIEFSVLDQLCVSRAK